MNKIIYVANITLPSERAHSIQIMKTCEALSQKGERIELWITNRNGRKSSEDIFSFYGIRHKFPIKKIPVIELFSKKNKWYFYIESLTFLAMVFFKIFMIRGNLLFYTRDESVQFLKFFTGKKIIWEAHMIPKFDFLTKWRLKKINGIIAISESLKKILINKYKIDSDKISVAHDAVDLDDFSNFLPKNKARELLDIPQDKKVVLYVGGIARHKGIFVLLDTAKMLGSEYLIEIVGWFIHDESGKAKKYVEDNKINNVVFRGYIPRNDIPKYLSSADVLVIPNSGLNEESRDFTSPMKLFEYMSSGKPIVASATTTILEILNEKNAILVRPDRPEDLKNGILKVFKDEDLAKRIAENSKKDVQEHAWIKRAEKISAFINSLSILKK